MKRKASIPQTLMMEPFYYKRKERRKIIIVDDEPRIARLCSLLFSRIFIGYKVIQVFANGKEVVDYVANLGVNQEAPEVIVIDYQMPIMDGLEAAKILRAIRPGLKIILVSAYDVPKEEEGYFDAIVKKPFSADDLLQAISGLVWLKEERMISPNN